MIRTSGNNLESVTQEQGIYTESLSSYPHYSQLDPDWGFELGTERMMCGFISVKSVIDYHDEKSGMQTPSVNTLLDMVEDADDAKPNGMSHAVEVDMLKSQGLVAWRRNWDAASSNTQWFVDNENYSAEQVAAINTQQLEELVFDDVQERELLSITNSLNDKNPVIVSVKPGFGGNRADHQIVIVGIETAEQGDAFIIMDPEHAPGSTLHTEPVERFFEYFNHRAIFAKQ